MEKREINVFDYAKEITNSLSSGALLTTRYQSKTNSMTIGWGTLGIVWGEPIFIAFVRTGRFTRELLDASGEFTVNIPFGVDQKKAIAYCGSRTGRDCNKLEELGLTLVESDLIKAPAISELPLTLECQVIYSQLLDRNAIPIDIRERMYPENVDSSNPMANRDYHIAYYGKILKSYLIK